MSDHLPMVLTELRGHVGIVRLNRPARHNALVVQTIFPQLEAGLRTLAAEQECRAVVLTGEGPSFCSGLDLGAPFGDPSLGPVRGRDEALRSAVSAVLTLREIPQPVIAAVHGHAIGAGFALAVVADLRVAAPDASFRAAFTRVGMTAGDLGLSWLLPRLIGPARAAELFYTGGSLTGEQAAALGLVNRLDDDPVAAAMRLAEEVAASAPLGIRHTKELLNASLGMSGFRQHLESEARSQAICAFSEDHEEARMAFAQCRQPVFSGR